MVKELQPFPKVGVPISRKSFKGLTYKGPIPIAYKMYFCLTVLEDQGSGDTVDILFYLGFSLAPNFRGRVINIVDLYCFHHWYSLVLSLFMDC